MAVIVDVLSFQAARQTDVMRTRREDPRARDRADRNRHGCLGSGHGSSRRDPVDRRPIEDRN